MSAYSLFFADTPRPVALLRVSKLMIVAVFLSGRIQHFYIKIEERFFANFHVREVQVAKKRRHELAPRDAHLVHYSVSSGSKLGEKTLEEVAIREKFGLNIAMIKRIEVHTIPAPGRFERIYPGGTLFLIGTDEQIELFKQYEQPQIETGLCGDMKEEVSLVKIAIDDGSSLVGKTIPESGIRERTNNIQKRSEVL